MEEFDSDYQLPRKPANQPRKANRRVQELTFRAGSPLHRVRQKKRKSQHNVLSQRGREKIMEQIKQLKELLPECNTGNVTPSKAEILQCALKAIERELLVIELYSHEIAAEMAENEFLRQQYEQSRASGYDNIPLLPPPIGLLDPQWSHDDTLISEDPLMNASDGGPSHDYSWSSAIDVIDSGQTSPEEIYSTPSYSNHLIQPHSPQAQSQYYSNLNDYNSEQPQDPTTFGIPSFRTNDLSFPHHSQESAGLTNLEKVQPKLFKQLTKCTSLKDKRPTKKRRVQMESNFDAEFQESKVKKETIPQLTLLQFDQEFDGPIIQNLSVEPPTRMYTEIVLTESSETELSMFPTAKSSLGKNGMR